MDLNVAFMNGFPRVSAEGKQLKEWPSLSFMAKFWIFW
jgi:hypothetical protein